MEGTGIGSKGGGKGGGSGNLGGGGGGGSPPPTSDNAKIKHIFVLVMENRSFDHFLGFSGIKGKDWQTGQTRMVEGLIQGADNAIMRPVEYYNDYAAEYPEPGVPPEPTVYSAVRYLVTPDAGDTIYNGHDVQHQFYNVMTQLCGQGLGPSV